MSKPVFVGAGVAIVTPFYENGGINFDELKRLIEFQIEQKIDAIVICGSTGEAATMTEQEHIDAIKFAVDTVAGRVPTILHSVLSLQRKLTNSALTLLCS